MNYNQPIFLNENTEFTVGSRARFGKNVTFGPNCKKIQIGHYSFIGDGVYIDVEELSIGDYFTLHHGSLVHGKKCVIGHNNWIGHYTILDALGGLLLLGNNVGVGAHSQLWSHMKFGDRMEGCRWHNFSSLEVGDDVWFVGHCIVSPVKVEDRAMLMLGGVAVKDMKYNRIYAGSPAVDVTEKLGHQFQKVGIEKKEAIFLDYKKEYESQGNDVRFIKVVQSFDEIEHENVSYFNLLTREYLPSYSDEESKFMRFLLYDKAKFIPIKKTE